MAHPCPSSSSFSFMVAAAVVVAAASLADVAAASPSSPKATPPPPPPCMASQSVVVFLRARCASTLYRLTCYDALIPYGCTFRTSPVKLARAAADVNAASLKNLTALTKQLVSRGIPGEAPGIAKEIQDCASGLSSALSLAKQTAAELARLDAMGDAPTGNQASWALSNAKTWLSAAMTNEATCADELGSTGAAVSPAAREVIAGVVTARQYTSIALSFVNAIPLS
ncbi:pectinesterase inhibitor 10-like [Oryza brachyantha]|uniref:pectinesterase inhibitor 10-like n=1 Tax=Oryza brachyantha TaxID=4533 RepID=UPI001ADA7580|nr:pectinesterase inhibitor 10-like [Oryza brachyantha]XP_040383887.1 pectinesterase inhibitor 10-like [Oryza brachyantha]XP_040383888.1 pectinesterase inhibitor 10-like [Oryza brachyantha]XP_040383889.1 pectinesterase inhibitor 10-like [Oryza brachyantha]XP_040383890.1 pectinesterase inhibitor 10-like [Oryza brachyantha]XP_040383891.1 pectinesterase inhibitor 10-like [Oryza brachyantha]